jgi:hypothetical protein
MYKNSNLLFCYPLCFEGEEPKAEEVQQEKKTTVFTQDDVNKFLADDRRKHQERYSNLEKTYQSVLGSNQLGQAEREKLEKDLQDLQASFRTKEQQLEFEKKQAAKQYEDDLTKAKQQVTRWEQLYRDEKIDRSLLDAAGQDAFNPSQIVNLLRPVTELKEEVDSSGRPTNQLIPMVKFRDIDEKTGEPIETLRTPQDAVKRMKELPNLYGNLFKSNVVSGVGAGAAQSSGISGGKIDVTRLSPEQYRKLRTENPEALGLSRRGRL